MTTYIDRTCNSSFLIRAYFEPKRLMYDYEILLKSNFENVKVNLKKYKCRMKENDNAVCVV